MFNTRVLTALIGIPLAIYAINRGGLVYFSIISFLALIAWHEYVNMLSIKQIKVPFFTGIVYLILLLGCAWWGNAQEMLLVITLALLMTIGTVVIKHSSFTIENAVYTITGIFYIGIPFAHLLLLRLTDATVSMTGLYGGTLSAGAVYLWLAFTGTWANDTFAYFVGSVWGKRKLCPEVSPGKTIEGTVGGIFGTVGVTLAFGWTYGLPWLHLLVIGIFVGIAAPIGDLTESALKRFTGVKDSGRLLPGHGGVLDRFDSMMFTAPIVYYYVRIFFIQ